MTLRAMVVLMLLLCEMAPLYSAQGRPQVDLICEIEPIALKALWRPSAEIARKTCELVADHLESDSTFFSYWQFHVGKSDSPWSLRISLKDGRVPEENLLWLEFQTPKEHTEWMYVWRSPGDQGLRPDPIADKAPQEIFRSVRLLIQEARPSLEGKFTKVVPIGRGGVVYPADSGIGMHVLSWLPWDRFQSLLGSEFDVLCHHKQRGPVVLHSEGHSKPLDYKMRGKVVALAVRSYRFKRRQDQSTKDLEPAEIQQLKPGNIFLKNIQPEWEVF